MSQGVQQPIGQKRLTNIALVKYKKHGKRFEIACYKNKVVNWRNGVEKDLDEVLQTTAVFTSVSKGVLAKKEDLQLVFKTDDEEKICLRILSEGEFQVSDKEREVEYQNLFRDVASILAEKCVNSQSSRPFTITMLERTMKDLHISVDPKRNAKQQALEVLPRLQSKLPIQRAKMRLKMVMPATSSRDILQMLQSQNAVIESQDLSGTRDTQVSIVFLSEPGFFRSLHAFVQQASEGSGRLEVQALAATAEGQPDPDFASAPKPSPVQPSTPSLGEAPRDAAGAAASARATIGDIRQPGHRPQPAVQADARIQGGVIMPRGPIQSLPEDLGPRRERFVELDALQAGWEVELVGKKDGGPVDAIFYSPAGDRVGAFTNARRSALQASKSS